MTHEEDDTVVEYTLKKIAGRIPVIVGSGSNCTETAIEKSVKYDKMGADALLVISPYYNKTNTQGMIHHFTAVADAVDKPVIIYNVPGRTGCNISEEAVPFYQSTRIYAASKKRAATSPTPPPLPAI